MDANSRTWRSPDPFPSERIGAAAIYCSDGRFGEAFDDFLHNQLRLPHYDRLAIPGGAAALAGHFVAYREEEAAREHLRFLISVHEIEQVVLIAHRSCAFYLKRLHISEDGLRRRQELDLATAAEVIRSLGPHLRIDAFLARVDDHRVAIEPVPLPAHPVI